MEIQKASLLKRVTAALFDLIVFYIVASIFSSFIGNPIAQKTTKINEYQNEFMSELFDIGYYDILNGFEVITFNNDSTKINSAKESIKNGEKDYSYVLLTDDRVEITNEQLEAHINHFYTSVGAEGLLLNHKKEATDIFVVDENNNVTLKDDLKDKEASLKEFYIKIYNGLLSEKNKNSEKQELYVNNYKDGKLIKLSSSIQSISLMVIVICFLLSSLIFFFMVPMISKKGQTFGKKLLSLIPVDVKTGLVANRVQLTIRFFAFAIIELLLSVYLRFIPLFISLIVMLFTKKGQAIHDFLARTVVVDSITHSFEENNDVIEVEANESVKSEENVDEVNSNENKFEEEKTINNAEKVSNVESTK